MQPHSGAAITVITHLWPKLHLDEEQLQFRRFEIYTQYFRRTKLHSLLVERINPQSEELTLQIGKDWPCHLKIRFNPVRQEVKFLEHSHGRTQEEWRLFLPNRLEGDYWSEPIAGFSTRHVINADVLDSERTQIRFADVFEGDEEDPRRKYNFQYECRILAKYP